MIFDGAERPQDSPHFLRLYKDWYKRRRSDLGRYVAGAIRIEPDDGKRNAVLGKLMNVALAAFMPYPFRVVASEQFVEPIVAGWLPSRPR